MSLDCKVALDLAKHEREQGDYHAVVCPECSSTDIDFQEKVWIRREVLGMKGGVLQVSGAFYGDDGGSYRTRGARFFTVQLRPLSGRYPRR